MMKLLVHTLLLLFLHQVVRAQLPVPDSARVLTDTTSPQPSEKIPVLSDTVQYNDTVIRQTAAGPDTVVKKKVHSPRRATLRSLIIPGWGQVYNKKYWKVPIVYTAIGIPASLFFYNKSFYNKTRYALQVVADTALFNDPAAMAKVDPRLIPLVEAKEQGSLINYRNEFRKNMDYSILFTLLAWGLNVVDATVDAHLKGFDVSDDLSLKVKPTLQHGTYAPGVSLVVNFK